MIEQLWTSLSEVGITTQDFVVVVRVNELDGERKYVYFFEGTG